MVSSRVNPTMSRNLWLISTYRCVSKAGLEDGVIARFAAAQFLLCFQQQLLCVRAFGNILAKNRNADDLAAIAHGVKGHLQDAAIAHRVLGSKGSLGQGASIEQGEQGSFLRRQQVGWEHAWPRSDVIPVFKHTLEGPIECDQSVVEIG